MWFFKVQSWVVKYDMLFFGNSSYSSCFLIHQNPVPNIINYLYKPLEPKVHPIIGCNAAPMLSRNVIYFSKAVRSYGNTLLRGIVVFSVVPSPFIMILRHLGEDTLWEIPTRRPMPDTLTLAHTCKCISMHRGIKTRRHMQYHADTRAPTHK